MSDMVKWLSPTGRELNFQVFSKNEGWNHVGGIYMFCDFKNKNYIPLYIGQTESFANRLPNHEKLQPAIKIGAKFILAAVESNKKNRDTVESLLIKEFQPVLNDQLK